MRENIQLLVDMWAKEYAQGVARGYDKADEWQSPPDYAIAKANEWERSMAAWRLIVGVNLANEALDAALTVEGEQA